MKLESILPAVITIIGNILFYLIIKNRVEKSIEEHRIVFSGIFKEKIEIYQNLLEKSYNLKFNIDNYYANGNQNEVDNIFAEIQNFVLYYLKNQPFLSKDMIVKLEKIRIEFQFIFNNSYEYHSVSKVSGIQPHIVKEIEDKFTEVTKRMKDNEIFTALQGLIITEMRKDLKNE